MIGVDPWNVGYVRRVRIALASLVAFLAVTVAGADAGTARRTCPGVSCAEAKRVARAYGLTRSTAPWFCALAHAPFDRINGRIVGFSCGRGGSRGDLRKWPHAFVGTIRG